MLCHNKRQKAGGNQENSLFFLRYFSAFSFSSNNPCLFPDAFSQPKQPPPFFRMLLSSPNRPRRSSARFFPAQTAPAGLPDAAAGHSVKGSPIQREPPFLVYPQSGSGGPAGAPALPYPRKEDRSEPHNLYYAGLFFGEGARYPFRSFLCFPERCTGDLIKPSCLRDRLSGNAGSASDRLRFQFRPCEIRRFSITVHAKSGVSA